MTIKKESSAPVQEDEDEDDNFAGLQQRDCGSNVPAKPLGNQRFKSRLDKSIMRMKTQNNLAGMVSMNKLASNDSNKS